MASFGSMQYTIGTALDRAREAGHHVEVLVGNQWVAGAVVAHDGIGVVLDDHGREHCIVRLESIAAVRVSAEAPRLAGHDAEDTQPFDGARPMPGPRFAAAV